MGISIDELSKKTGLSKSTVGSYLRLSSELGLTHKNKEISLTNLGRNYVDKKTQTARIEYINDEQTEILKECKICGYPTTREVCQYCTIKNEVQKRRG